MLRISNSVVQKIYCSLYTVYMLSAFTYFIILESTSPCLHFTPYTVTFIIENTISSTLELHVYTYIHGRNLRQSLLLAFYSSDAKIGIQCKLLAFALTFYSQRLHSCVCILLHRHIYSLQESSGTQKQKAGGL